MIRPSLLILALSAAAPASGADLPSPPGFAGRGAPDPFLDGGGFRVARVPVRPAPLRYDVYGYPLFAVPPSPLEAGGCPAALQPDYDADGNLAGYAPLPMCR